MHVGVGKGRQPGPALRPRFGLQNPGRGSFCHSIKWLFMWGLLKAMGPQRHNAAQNRGSGIMPTSEGQDGSPLSFAISLVSDRAEVKTVLLGTPSDSLRPRGRAQHIGLDKVLWDPGYQWASEGRSLGFSEVEEHFRGGWGPVWWDRGKSYNLCPYHCCYPIHRHRLWVPEKLVMLI